MGKDALIRCKDISFTLPKKISSGLFSKIMLKHFQTATKKAVTQKGNSSGNIHYKCLLVNEETFFTGFFQAGANAFFIDSTQC